MHGCNGLLAYLSQALGKVYVRSLGEPMCVCDHATLNKELT